MFGSLKINTAIVICSGFIFRLLFVNIGIISSLEAQQNNRVIKAHISPIIKKRRHFEALNNSNDSKKIEYSTAEICEEKSDEDNQFKANYFSLTQTLYSLTATKLESALKNILPVHNFFSHSSSGRYQVFRI